MEKTDINNSSNIANNYENKVRWCEDKKGYNSQYYQENSDVIKQRSSKYYYDNIEEEKVKRKKYRDSHKEDQKIWMNQWKEKNPQRYRASRILCTYKRNDKKYNRENNLTSSWIVERIFSQPCYYCGETDWKKIGCDRIDNSIGHIMTNVIPCCGKCNNERKTKGFDEFCTLKNNKEKKIM